MNYPLIGRRFERGLNCTAFSKEIYIIFKPSSHPSPNRMDVDIISIIQGINMKIYQKYTHQKSQPLRLVYFPRLYSGSFLEGLSPPHSGKCPQVHHAKPDGLIHHRRQALCHLEMAAPFELDEFHDILVNSHIWSGQKWVNISSFGTLYVLSNIYRYKSRYIGYVYMCI